MTGFFGFRGFSWLDILNVAVGLYRRLLMQGKYGSMPV